MTHSTYMRNVNMGDDAGKEKELHDLTASNASEHNEGSSVEDVLGSVHISKPTIQHVFFLLKPILNPILKQFVKLQTDLDELVNEMKLERVFLDKPASISQNVPYTVDYRQRKFLYLLCQQTLTLVVNGTAVTTTPGQWTALAYPIGTQITAQGVSDATPIPVTIRATDVQLTLNIGVLGTVNVSVLGTALTTDQIHNYIALGQGFRATTGQVATGAASAFIGIQGRAQNLGVNVVIYRIMAIAQNNAPDGRVLYNTTGANLDAGLTTNLLTANAGNQIVGGANPQLTTLMGSPAGTTEVAGMGGTGAIQTGMFGAGTQPPNELLIGGSQIILPKGTDRNFSVYAKIATSTNTAGYMIEWVEF